MIDYQPLSESELMSIEPSLRLRALEIRFASLENQIFRGVSVDYHLEKIHPDLTELQVGDHKTIIDKTTIPETFPTEDDWINYLMAKKNYHSQAASQSRSENRIGDERFHEHETMRSDLAIGTLQGKNNRPDLVIAAVREVLAIEEGRLAEATQIKLDSKLPNRFVEIQQRVLYARRFTQAMESRFGDSK